MSTDGSSSFLAREDRPRVLYVIEQSEFSGAEVLAMPLMRDDPDALLACPPGSNTERWARDHGVPTTPLPQRTMRHSAGPVETLRSIPRGLAGARDLRRLLRRHPERGVVYAIAIRSSLLAALAALGMRRRVVWLVTDFPPPQPALRAATRLLAALGCDGAVAISHAVERHFAGRWSLLRRRTDVVHPGLDAARYASGGVERDPKRAAILGHVSPTKRTDVAVEVARLVAAEDPDFALDVIGRAQFRDEDFALEARLREEVAADQLLAGRVTFRGYSNDPATELQRYGILLHCRPDEPFGVVVIEAMAAGLAVVAPGSDGPAEIVRDGETGLLYPPGDARAAAEAVLRLLRDRALRDRLAAAGRADVAARFTVEGQLSGLVGALEQVSAGFSRR